MSEQTQRGKVVAMLSPLHAIPVENPVHLGTPDVNYTQGWIELKWLRSWPKREETPVRFPHFTVQQRRWLRRRIIHGGLAWLLVQCRTEWFLFDAIQAEYVGHVARSGLYTNSHRFWKHGLVAEELISCLTGMCVCD